jgi:hypothetical protein
MANTSLIVTRTVSSSFTKDIPERKKWLHIGMRLCLLVLGTYLAGHVLGLLLPGIFARAFKMPIESFAPVTMSGGAFVLLSLFRALLSFRLIEADHVDLSIGVWVLASLAIDNATQLLLTEVLTLTPVFGYWLTDSVCRAGCIIGGGMITALVQWALLSPRSRWSWIWMLASCLGWLGNWWLIVGV